MKNNIPPLKTKNPDGSSTYDLRGKRSKFKATDLKEGDTVIYSDKHKYIIRKDGSYKRI